MSAQILSFTLSARSSGSSRKAAVAGTGASVVILPCVRYERWSDEETPTETVGKFQGQLASAHH